MRFIALLLILAACSSSGGDSSDNQQIAPPIASCSVTPSAAWKGALTLPQDPFVIPSIAFTIPSWIKFTVLECDSTAVYFQDGNHYAFHFDFAVNELDPFLGLSRSEFDDRTLRESGREAILGAVLLPPQSALLAGVNEFGIQLVGLDPIAPERVIEVFRLVKDQLGIAPTASVYYFPTFEQQATAEVNRALLEGEGVTVSSADRWTQGNVVYSNGWALGRLKSFPAEDLDRAYESGDLEPGDILLTDAIPASVPLVAGILTLSPSTPSSHTAILSQTFGVPFGYLSNPDDRAGAQALIGRRVVVRAYERFLVSQLDVIDVEDALDQATVADILQLKQPPELNLPAVAPLGEIARPTALLGLDDARFVGGKSAGFGILTRSIPDKVPGAVAFSFDLWSGFMDQPLAARGLSLREAIADRLTGYAYPPVNMAALAADLEAVRDLIKDSDSTSFAPGHEAAVLSVLLDPQHGFQGNQKIRFRSSSNMEDAEQFTGAGLYSSFSGCLMDELDGDDLGPSACDSSKAKERGVFRAIRKVFASFFDDSPYLARLRYGVDEHDVGMAILAHHSFPDEFELANGVASFSRSFTSFDMIEFVTQAGAESVTNPEPGQIPEVVQAYLLGLFNPVLEVRQYSNLTQLGATVMDWTSDYAELVSLLQRAGERFELETGTTDYVLEFEFKKLSPGGAALPSGGLVVKQLRQIPRPDKTLKTVPFLIGGVTGHTTYQGEASNVISNHRLKVELELGMRSGWLDELLLEANLYTGASMRFTDGCGIFNREFSLADPAEALQGWRGNEYELLLEMPALTNPRTVRLKSLIFPQLVSDAQSPILIPSDLGSPRMVVKHDFSVAVWSAWPILGLSQVFEESVLLTAARETDAADSLQVRHIENDGIIIDVRFFWPSPPNGLTAGYTAPLVRWQESVITGLTQDPIVLRGEFSQTYRPEHHNFSEHFVFEPRLEPEMSAATLAELEAQGIYLIHAVGSPFLTDTTIVTYSEAEVGHLCPTSYDSE